MNSGEMLGPYRILEKLGEGGMGEVFKARDSRLDRTVAIKVLPPDVSAVSDPSPLRDPQGRAERGRGATSSESARAMSRAERHARFEREAKAIAGLNHPHICTLHDVGHHDGTMFLVMEYLAGETLAARLAKGPLPLEQALTIATQIADALAAAHRQGVIHRDLKPGNVMLTKAGAKLLDFGLAKLTGHGEQPALMSQTYAVTQGAPVTTRGTILGTLQYMSPEQLEGKEVDARADLWALGAILYEMVTGRRAFAGDSEMSLIANIMNAEVPALASLQPLAPRAVERVVKSCLAKHRDDRWDSAHDLADELRWILQSGGVVTGAVVRAPRARAWRGLASTAVVLFAVAAGAALTWLLRPPSRTPSGVMRALVSVAPADRLQSQPVDVTIAEERPSQIALALSTNGRLLVFSAVKGDRQQLYLRPIDRLEATPLEDTEGAANPFFSPDGKWIGFWADGALKKVAVSGGPATTICATERVFGASWGDDDSVVFAQAMSPLLQVSASGGVPRPVTTLDEREGEVSHRLPHVLPGAKAVLFTAVTHFLPDWDDAEIVVQSLPHGARKAVARGADARYLPTGHLLFVRAGAVVAAPFDLKKLEITGGVVSVVSGVMLAQNTPNSATEIGAAQLVTSASGLLVYAAGGAFRDQDRLLIWVDRNGKEEALPLPPRAYLGPHLSPDGRQIVVWTQGRERVVWVYDLVRGTMTRVTAEGRNSRVIWRPDGRRLTLAAATAGPEEVVSIAADGSGNIERYGIRGQPSSWSSDGSVLAFLSSPEAPGGRISLFPVGKGEPRHLLNSRFNEAYPEFSPDGRWIAYTSDETGQNEVYAQPYPGPGERQQLSNRGGTQPAWHGERELFYTEVPEGTRRTRMMSVEIAPGPRLRAGVPRVLFEGVYRGQANTRGYDVSADGRRFLMVKPIERPPSPVTQLVMIEHWFEELKAKVPTP